jgi:hypothetical protein
LGFIDGESMDGLIQQVAFYRLAIPGKLSGKKW